MATYQVSVWVYVEADSVSEAIEAVAEAIEVGELQDLDPVIGDHGDIMVFVP